MQKKSKNQISAQTSLEMHFLFCEVMSNEIYLTLIILKSTLKQDDDKNFKKQKRKHRQLQFLNLNIAQQFSKTNLTKLILEKKNNKKS